MADGIEEAGPAKVSEGDTRSDGFVGVKTEEDEGGASGASADRIGVMTTTDTFTRVPVASLRANSIAGMYLSLIVRL